MLHFAHRGIIDYENTIKGVVEIFNNYKEEASYSDLGVEIDVRFNTARRVVLCHDRENRNEIENDTLYELLKTLNHKKYHSKKLMIDIKAFGITHAKELAHAVCDIIKKFPDLYNLMDLYLCSFNEYCVSELLFLCEDMHMSNIKIGVITTGIPLGLYSHLEQVDFISLDYGILCEEVMDEFKKKGVEIYTGVVNDSCMKILMYKYRVDGIIYYIRYS